MARVAGVDIPDGKRVEVALRRIYGIGPRIALRVLDSAKVTGNPRVKDLPEDDLNRIREVIDKENKVEGDLRREVNMNIRRLMDIGSYRGLRHRRGLPAHGQRTKTNARTKRGGRRTVAGRRQVRK
ncbi:30S ribosomal protein S13 [SAR202 cluster bacterium AD-493-K16_JPT_193m]|nr:30S ribosomal protein S13 [SAR202 cluster bacterium AD-493-K16_JPT_193m]|tara:strand:- start:536 stop:913 length:378 start_codon:yes stop_codon:yes gene_type:complete